MPTAIPVRNIYFLLCYAWNQLQEKGLVDVATAGTTELIDMLARVYVSGVSRLRRRGLERGYTGLELEIAGVRGRINILETVSRFQDRHGRATCLFDELNVDTPQNRVVKAAMRRLLAIGELNIELRGQLNRFVREQVEVTDYPLSRELLRGVRLHSNNHQYRFLIDAAALILACAVMDEAKGTFRFRDFTREGPEMARLFEHFVRNFLKRERPDLVVQSEQLEWIASSDQEQALSFLPGMRTDITVRTRDRTVVIDTKFYEDTLQTYFGKRSIHSAHLYQMTTYLRNMESLGGPDSNAEGMLLYPATADTVDLAYVIQGHKVRIRTIDLSREWHDIEADMLQLI